MLTVEDVSRIFEAKCRKYSKEDLTTEMKNILLQEAIQEVNTMNCVNNVSVC